MSFKSLLTYGFLPSPLSFPYYLSVDELGPFDLEGFHNLDFAIVNTQHNEICSSLLCVPAKRQLDPEASLDLGSIIW